MNVYVASSWRNPYYDALIGTLRDLLPSIEFYNFKNPAPGNNGFSWKQIQPDYENWTTKQYIKILDHPLSKKSFADDFGAMQAADMCVLVLPSGRSAHIEAGYFIGAKKPLIIFIPENKTEPELMYKMTDHVLHDTSELIKRLGIFGTLWEKWHTSGESVLLPTYVFNDDCKTRIDRITECNCEVNAFLGRCYGCGHFKSCPKHSDFEDSEPTAAEIMRREMMK